VGGEKIIAVVGSAASLRNGMLDLPCASFPENAVVAEAQTLSANMALTHRSVVDRA